MAQPVELLRGFFQAFFAVEQPVWAGFLAGWPGRPNNDRPDSWSKRLTFALKLFFQMPTKVKITMILFAIRHTFEFGPNTLLRSLLPEVAFSTDGDDSPWTPPPLQVGERAAKDEARVMMNAFSSSKKRGLDPWRDLQSQDASSQESLGPVGSDVQSEYPSPFN